MPIREVGRGGERKKPEREEKEEEEGSGRKVGAGVKTPHRRQAQRQDLRRRTACHVTATSASSPRARRHADARTCKLGASNDDAELRVQILKSYLWKHICDFF